MVILTAGGRVPAAGAAALTSLVDPFSGTAAGAPNFGTGGGAANTFPGAVAPFGMLAWSPDTVPNTVNLAGGYTYGDHELAGLSLTHVSGAGCPVARDVSFLPTNVPLTGSPAQPGSSELASRYLASFSHGGEAASPGAYSVRLGTGPGRPIVVRLAATPRAGEGLIAFPRRGSATLLVNAGASASADTQARITIDPGARLLTGSASSGHFCFAGDTYKVFFAATFSRGLRGYGTWRRQALARGARSSTDSRPPATIHLGGAGATSILAPPSTPAQAGAYLRFRPGVTVLVRVGLSFVSAADALANLRHETGGRSFAAVRRGTQAAWESALSRIEVSGGTVAERRTFYTALYHALLAPSVFSDDNGRYMGMDGGVHHLSGRHAQYANFSGWDIYRSEIPLLAMLYPGRVSDMIRSLLADERQSGWLPKWPVAAGQTNVMVGDPADAIIAAAWAYGARSFDPETALTAMVKGATRPARTRAAYVERPGLAAYERLGYVPHELNTNSALGNLVPSDVWGSVATTLEYETSDFALANFAATAACRPATSRRFAARALGWSRLYDPATGYLTPRLRSGAFVAGIGATSNGDYVEGDAAQYTWMVPFDLAGLEQRLGGRRAALDRLDAFFAELNGGPDSPYAFLGDEPTLETPWVYDWLGAPARAQSTVRHALLTLYSAAPSGYPGNDDLGEMSSWFVFGALGLYPEIPGAPVLALASPLFRHALIRLGDGHVVAISGLGAAAGAPFVRALRLDGRPDGRPWLTYASLARGARLDYVLGHVASRWGTWAAAVPPSFGAGVPPAPCTASR